jgi:hypothetical protein
VKTPAEPEGDDQLVDCSLGARHSGPLEAQGLGLGAQLMDEAADLSSPPVVVSVVFLTVHSEHDFPSAPAWAFSWLPGCKKSRDRRARHRPIYASSLDLLRVRRIRLTGHPRAPICDT